MVTSQIIGRMEKRTKKGKRVYKGLTFIHFSIGWCKARDDNGKDYWFNSQEELLEFCESRYKIRYRHVQEFTLPKVIVARF